MKSHSPGMVRSRLCVILSAAAVAMTMSSAVADVKIEAMLRSSLASAFGSEAPGLKRMAADIGENAAGRNGTNITGWTRSFLV